MSQELTLFAFGGITEQQTQALVRVDKTSTKGLKSQTVKVSKKADLAKIIGTKDKDAINDFQVEVQDAILRMVRAELGGLDAGKWTGVSRRIAQKADGGQRMTIVLDSIVRSIITAEKLAKGFNITMEEAEEIIKKHMRIASPVHDINSEVVPPAQLAPPTESPEDKLAREALEAEEAARLAAVEEQKELAVA